MVSCHYNQVVRPEIRFSCSIGMDVNKTGCEKEMEMPIYPNVAPCYPHQEFSFNYFLS